VDIIQAGQSGAIVLPSGFWVLESTTVYFSILFRNYTYISIDLKYPVEDTEFILGFSKRIPDLAPTSYIGGS
jgi:hypothetical protein